MDDKLVAWASNDSNWEEIENLISEHGIALLSSLGKFLTQDLPIDQLEKYEEVYKGVLTQVIGKGVVDGRIAREIAKFQNQIGFLNKYKSYAVKASTPLGYSIFLQEQGEGFSFQQHVTHKVEAFHIVEVKPGGFVFLCGIEEWRQSYDKERFTSWLNGSKDPIYDAFRFYPETGDVFVMDETGVVHTVIGCILEEFATVSTDMVDRLHDQNAGKPIPQKFNRQYARDEIGKMQFPNTARNVFRDQNGWHTEDLKPDPIKGGHHLELARMAAIGSEFTIEPGGKTEIMMDPSNCAILYFSKGSGKLVLGDEVEMKNDNPPTLSAKKGDLYLIPAGSFYAFINESTDPMVLTQQQIPLEVAFHE